MRNSKSIENTMIGKQLKPAYSSVLYRDNLEPQDPHDEPASSSLK
jgi:hypothetical protein